VKAARRRRFGTTTRSGATLALRNDVLGLYDHPLSSNALKVRFLLAELDLPYEREHVPFARPRPETLTAFHPFSTIPARQRRTAAGRVERDPPVPGASRRAPRPLPSDAAACAVIGWMLDAWRMHVRPLHRLEAAAILFVEERSSPRRRTRD
jgi:hypothetical protein